jgi:hypothetical protein
MTTDERLEQLGFDRDQIAYLVGMSQDVSPRDAFSDEVQQYLDDWREED